MAAGGSRLTLEGGCFCGRVRYVVEGTPYHATLCHGGDCRRAAGAPVVGWFTVKLSEVRFTPAPELYESSPGKRRGFCRVCGTALSFRNETLAEIDVTIGSLNEPGAVPPADHTFGGERLPWLKLADDMPVYERVRPTP